MYRSFLRYAALASLFSLAGCEPTAPAVTMPDGGTSECAPCARECCTIDPESGGSVAPFCPAAGAVCERPARDGGMEPDTGLDAGEDASVDSGIDADIDASVVDADVDGGADAAMPDAGEEVCERERAPFHVGPEGGSIHGEPATEDGFTHESGVGSCGAGTGPDRAFALSVEESGRYLVRVDARAPVSVFLLDSCAEAAVPSCVQSGSAVQLEAGRVYTLIVNDDWRFGVPFDVHVRRVREIPEGGTCDDVRHDPASPCAEGLRCMRDELGARCSTRDPCADLPRLEDVATTGSDGSLVVMATLDQADAHSSCFAAYDLESQMWFGGRDRLFRWRAPFDGVALLEARVEGLEDEPVAVSLATSCGDDAVETAACEAFDPLRTEVVGGRDYFVHVDAGATAIADGTDPLGARFTLTLLPYVPRTEGERCDPTGTDEAARCAVGLACASERGEPHCRAIDAGCGMGVTVVELELAGDHARVTGDAAGGTAEYQPLCSGALEARGQEVAHRMVLPHDAIVSAELAVGARWRGAQPSVVIATSCRDRLETVGCGLGGPGRPVSARSAPLRAGTEVFVIVDASTSLVVAPYELDVRLLPVGALGAACGEACAPGLACVEGSCRAACGDGSAQPGEECDDGGLATGDGCDASCRVEPEAALGGCAAPRRLGLRAGPGGSRVAIAEGDTTGAPAGDPSSCGRDAMPQHAFVLELDEASDVRVWLDPEAGYDALLVAVGATCGATLSDRTCSDTYARESLELAGLAAGTHHLLVTGYSPSFAPRSAGRYRLRVEVTPTSR